MDSNMASDIEAYGDVYISVIRGLINYHKRMTAPLEAVDNKCEKKVCPVLEFERDLYLRSLEVALGLMEREFGRK